MNHTLTPNTQNTYKKTEDFRVKYKTEVPTATFRSADIGLKKDSVLSEKAYPSIHSVHLRTLRTRNTHQTPPPFQLQNQTLHQLYPQRLLHIRHPLPVPARRKRRRTGIGPENKEQLLGIKQFQKQRTQTQQQHLEQSHT